MGIALTKRELANIAGYTYQRLHQINRDLPPEKQLFVQSGDGKKYDLAMFVQRWVDYNTGRAETESEELSVVKARHEAIKMEKTGLEVARMKGEYVSIEVLAPIWTHIAATVAERFNSLPQKIAPSLVMIGDPEIIAEKIEREIRDAQSLLARMPLPSAERGTEDAEDSEE